jgi:TonB family protein
LLPLLVGFALLFGNIFAADKKSDKQQDGLKGPVGSVRVEKATITKENNQPVEGQRRRSHKIRYNEKGEMVEMIIYTSDSISRLLLFTGDAQGNTLASVFERGNPLALPPPPDSSTPQVTSSKKVFKHVFKYDSKGNRTEDAVYAEDGTLSGKDVYLFDIDGKPYGVRSFDEKGPTGSSRFTCDSKGMILTQSFTSQTGKITEKRTYAYELDAQGNWIKQTALKILDTGKIEPIEVVYRTLSYYPPVGTFSGLGVIGGISKEGAEKNENTSVTRMTGAVLAGSATRRVEPVYPSMAKAAHIQGVVIVEVTLDEEGDVLTARTLQGHPLLKDGAEKAALGWKFTPTSLNGMPVRVVGTLTFNFNL